MGDFKMFRNAIKCFSFYITKVLSFLTIDNTACYVFGLRQSQRLTSPPALGGRSPPPNPALTPCLTLAADKVWRRLLSPLCDGMGSGP